jgi:hypothetical protein
MSTDDLFRPLDPPPGGAERFARRLDELAATSPAPSRRGPALAAAACVVLMLVAAVVWLREPDEARPLNAVSQPTIDVYGAPEFDRLLGRTRAPAELTVVVGAEPAAVTQLETGNEKVRIYRIN